MAYWGECQRGAVDLLTIGDGMSCTARIGTQGARLVQLWVPDRHGTPADIVLGHDLPAAYETPASTYFGATCGRYANRIAGGRFDLDGHTVHLDRNEGQNHLHGGTDGFDRQIWTVTQADDRAATLHLHSPDGAMGYPGALQASVTYAFTAPGELQITMTASVSGRPSVVNMVNHAYFNLAGQDGGTVASQLLQIDANTYLPVDAALLPQGPQASVAGTHFDFRTLRPIGADVPRGGFDHNFCLRASDGPSVVAVDPASGRALRLWTDQPGVQFYTGAHVPAGLVGKTGARLGPDHGFTLETQTWPDSPNRAEYPPATLRPGQTYRHQMRFDFSPDSVAVPDALTQA